jgi:membrane-bound lytic murein transglycosylase D
MPSRTCLLALVSLAALGVAGCASGRRARVETAAQAPAVEASRPGPQPTTPETPPAPDPVELVIAAADRHFAAGQQELALGHLDQATRAFDRAVDVLLEAPDGAQGDPRLREHLDRIVDRIGVLEQAALVTGDGFTETHTEPAIIDQLLALGAIDTTPPTLATTEAVTADLEHTTHDIPIPANARVLRWVEIFQGRLREFLTDGLSRGAQYLPMIQSVFRAEGLPLDLAYVPLIESAFKPTAVSRAKARGVWQFMRGTARENGLQADWYLDERADPQKATVAAARYLKTLYGMFDDWHLAMASYNGGPGRVQRAMKRSRKDDFWSLTASTRYLPRETRDYVPMILAAIIIAKNPGQYGFDIVAPVPAPTEAVALPAAVDLRRVAEWAGVPVDDIQRLNPELRRWTTPLRDGHYDLDVPAGTADKVRDGLAASSPSQLNALQWHTVKKGETLATIARQLRVSRTDLAEANYLKTTSRVGPGQRLVVPRMPSAALLAQAGAGTPTEVPGEGPDRAAADGGETHRVRAGDSLYKIARRYGTTVERLMEWNNLKSSILSIGARLIVQAPRAASTQQ